jgi:drug/metabolite transporter (DMT)-like permease
MPSQSKKAYIYAGIAILFWSTVATAFKLGLAHISIPVLLFWSSLTSLLVISVILLVSGSYYRLLKQSLRDILLSALAGFLNPFAYYLVLFKAYSLLPAQIAQPLNYLWPLVLVLLSAIFLKQQINKQKLLALFISFLGVAIISIRSFRSEASTIEFTGIALALGSSVIWASYWLITLHDKRPEPVKLFYNFLFGTIYLVLLNLPHFNLLFQTDYLAAPIYIGIFEMGLTFFCWLKALKLAQNKVLINNLVYLGPFLSLVFIGTILSEKISFTTIAGLLLIVSGILVQSYFNKTHEV